MTLFPRHFFFFFYLQYTHLVALLSLLIDMAYCSILFLKNRIFLNEQTSKEICSFLPIDTHAVNFTQPTHPISPPPPDCLILHRPVLLLSTHLPQSATVWHYLYMYMCVCVLIILVSRTQRSSLGCDVSSKACQDTKEL